MLTFSDRRLDKRIALIRLKAACWHQVCGLGLCPCTCLVDCWSWCCVSVQDDVRWLLSVLREPGRVSACQHVSSELWQDVDWVDDQWRVGDASPCWRMCQQPSNVPWQPSGRPTHSRCMLPLLLTITVEKIARPTVILNYFSQVRFTYIDTRVYCMWSVLRGLVDRVIFFAFCRFFAYWAEDIAAQTNHTCTWEINFTTIVRRKLPYSMITRRKCASGKTANCGHKSR